MLGFQYTHDISLKILGTGDGADSDDEPERGACASAGDAAGGDLGQVMAALASARREAARGARALAAARDDLDRSAADAASSRAALAASRLEAANLRRERDAANVRRERVEATLRAERDEQDPTKRTLLRMAESSARDAHAAREDALKLRHALAVRDLELRGARDALAAASADARRAQRRPSRRASFFAKRSGGSSSFSSSFASSASSFSFAVPRRSASDGSRGSDASATPPESPPPSDDGVEDPPRRRRPDARRGPFFRGVEARDLDELLTREKPSWLDAEAPQPLERLDTNKHFGFGLGEFDAFFRGAPADDGRPNLVAGD